MVRFLFTNRLLIAAYCWCVLAASCTQRSADVLPIEKIEAIVLDAQLAEAYVTVPGSGILPNQKADSIHAFYGAICSKNGVSTTQFSESLAWYGKQPATLDTIYTHVVRRLEVLQDSLSKIPQALPAIPPPQPALQQEP